MIWAEGLLLRWALHGTAGLVYRAMGFPPQFFTVLFAIPRVTGYLSHWREQLTDPDVKIARPQQNYTVCSHACRRALSCSASDLLSI